MRLPAACATSPALAVRRWSRPPRPRASLPAACCRHTITLDLSNAKHRASTPQAAAELMASYQKAMAWLGSSTGAAAARSQSTLQTTPNVTGTQHLHDDDFIVAYPSSMQRLPVSRVAGWTLRCVHACCQQHFGVIPRMMQRCTASGQAGWPMWSAPFAPCLHPAGGTRLADLEARPAHVRHAGLASSPGPRRPPGRLRPQRDLHLVVRGGCPACAGAPAPAQHCTPLLATWHAGARSCPGHVH